MIWFMIGCQSKLILDNLGICFVVNILCMLVSLSQIVVYGPCVGYGACVFVKFFGEGSLSRSVKWLL